MQNMVEVGIKQNKKKNSNAAGITERYCWIIHTIYICPQAGIFILYGRSNDCVRSCEVELWSILSDAIWEALRIDILIKTNSVSWVRAD